MKKAFLILNFLMIPAAFAQNAATSLDFKPDVHLFQNFLFDSPVARSSYIEAGASYADFEHANSFDLEVQGGFPINDKIEVGGYLSFDNTDPDGGAKSESGLSDLTVVGRYLIKSGPTQISAGGMLTLPVGDKDLGYDNFNFGGFGALRHAVAKDLVLTAQASLDFIEIATGGNSTDRKTSFSIGGGAIYAVNSQLHVIGEARLRTKTDQFLISGGADYALKDKSRIRGGLGFGLDDGSPDFIISGSYLVAF